MTKFVKVNFTIEGEIDGPASPEALDMTPDQMAQRVGQEIKALIIGPLDDAINHRVNVRATAKVHDVDESEGNYSDERSN